MLAVTGAPPAQAAPTDVVINEMMFHALSDLDGDDYLELPNTGTTPVDLSGWTFSGITLTLPAGTTIAPGGFLVVAKDAVQFQATYGFAPAAVYGGNLSNSGETVALRDATAATIDTVELPRRRPLALHRRRHRPVPRAHRRHPEQRRPPQLGRRHQRQRPHPRRRQLRTPQRPRARASPA